MALSGSQRSPQHECLLPHCALGTPQLTGDLTRRNFLGQRLQLADVDFRPLATSNFPSCSHHRSPLRSITIPPTRGFAPLSQELIMTKLRSITWLFSDESACCQLKSLRGSRRFGCLQPR